MKAVLSLLEILRQVVAIVGLRRGPRVDPDLRPRK